MEARWQATLMKTRLLLSTSSCSDSFKLFMFTKTTLLISLPFYLKKEGTKNPRFSFSSWRIIFTRAVYFTSCTLNNYLEALFPIEGLVCRRCSTHLEGPLRLNIYWEQLSLRNPTTETVTLDNWNCALFDTKLHYIWKRRKPKPSGIYKTTDL